MANMNISDGPEGNAANKNLFQNVASQDFLKFSFGTSAYAKQLQSAIQKTGQVSAVR